MFSWDLIPCEYVYNHLVNKCVRYDVCLTFHMPPTLFYIKFFIVEEPADVVAKKIREAY